MKRLFVMLLGLCAFLFSFSLAFAHAAPPSPGSSSQYLQAILDAFHSKQWHLVIALVLIGIVAGLRWLAPKVHGQLGAWLNTQRGGTTLVLVCGVLTALGTSLYGGSKVSLNLVLSGVSMGVMASGGWNVLWDLISPSDKPPKTPSENSSPTVPIQKVS